MRLYIDVPNFWFLSKNCVLSCVENRLTTLGIFYLIIRTRYILKQGNYAPPYPLNDLILFKNDLHIIKLKLILVTLKLNITPTNGMA